MITTLACPESWGGADSKPWQPLAILVRVLTLVCLVVSDDTPRRGARSSVSSHVPRDTAHYRAFDASLGICRGACSEGYSQHEQCNEHFHFESPMSQPIHKKARRHLVPSDRRGNTEKWAFANSSSDPTQKRT
jgi:hypothetical protein